VVIGRLGEFFPVVKPKKLPKIGCQKSLPGHWRAFFRDSDWLAAALSFFF